MIDRPVFDLHGHVAHLRLPGREAVGEVAADHALDDAGLGDLLHALVQRLDGGAVADDGDLVRHIGDLVELVGDDDRSDVLLLAQAQQQIQQVLRVLLVQRGGRLVQNQQPHVLGQRLGDFHQLLLAHADVLDQRVGILVKAHDLQILRGARVGLVPVDHAAAGALVAQEHVLRNGEVGHQRQLLMDDDDAQLLRILDGLMAALLAVINNLALVASIGMDAGEHLHQRAFSSAVFAADRVDFALFHHEIDVRQRFHARKFLGNGSHFQKRFGHSCSPFSFTGEAAGEARSRRRPRSAHFFRPHRRLEQQRADIIRPLHD